MVFSLKKKRKKNFKLRLKNSLGSKAVFFDKKIENIITYSKQGQTVDKTAIVRLNSKLKRTQS